VLHRGTTEHHDGEGPLGKPPLKCQEITSERVSKGRKIIMHEQTTEQGCKSPEKEAKGKGMTMTMFYFNKGGGKPWYKKKKKR